MDLNTLEVKVSDGRGFGIYARKEIQEGQLLIHENPLVMLTVPHSPKTLAKFVGQLRNEVKHLEEDDQEIFFSLHNARPDLCTKSRGMLTTYIDKLHILFQMIF